MGADLLGLLGVLSPFILAGLLVVMGLAGGRLPAAKRTFIERRVFAPLLVVIAMVAIGFAVAEREWIRAAIMAAVAAIVGLRLFRQAPANSVNNPETGASA